MKKLSAMIVLCALVAVLAGGSYYAAATYQTRTLIAKLGGEMEWLRHEFHLTDAQIAQIQAAHAAYKPKCDALCDRIAKAHLSLRQSMAAGNGVTPEVKAALAECAAVELDCRTAMLDHIQTVSSYMAPASAARFRQLMEDRMIDSGSRAQMMFEE